MRAVTLMLLASLALSACGKQQQAQDQNIAIDEGVAANQVGNADIETLPADESSTTPTNQLANGYDNPDVNSVPSNSQ
jgi:hypothetical protein